MIWICPSLVYACVCACVCVCALDYYLKLTI